MLTFGETARTRRPEIAEICAQMDERSTSGRLPTDDEADALLPLQAEAVGIWLVNAPDGLLDSTSAFDDAELDELN